jgi:hypothetical protein
MFSHFFCCIITFWREVYDGSMSEMGKRMIVMEVLGIVIYYGPVLTALNFGSNWITL